MTADQRRAINRYNARKSTGPITPEGKERTRQNALKHGLCAATLALSHENADDLQDQFDEWVELYQPVGPAEFALVEEIAVAQLRLRRCRTREAAVLELQVGAAYEVWATKEVGRLSAGLTLIATDPAAAVRDLRQFGIGRRWMLERWVWIAGELLRKRYASTPALVDEGVRLLGGDPARPAAGPPAAYMFRLVCTGARPVADPKAIAWLLSDAAIHPQFLADYGREIPAPADCRDLAINMVSNEMEALQEEENGLREDERRETDGVRLRAQVPCDSPDTKLWLRYESMARGAFHKALKALDQLQDARFAAEAEGGAADVIALADTPPEPLPSVARNEPETPQEPQPSTALETSCDAPTEMNVDDSSGGCAVPSRAATAAPERAEASIAARPCPSPPVVPVVTPVTATSPPA